MPTIKHDTFFPRHPVFTGEELAEHLSTSGRAGARTQESLVAYHTRTGRLVRIRRGLFAVIPPEADGDTYQVEPMPDSVQTYIRLGSVPPHGVGVTRSGLLGMAASDLPGVAPGGAANVPLTRLSGSQVHGSACTLGEGVFRRVDLGARRHVIEGHES